MTKPSILIVDHDESICEMIASVLAEFADDVFTSRIEVTADKVWALSPSLAILELLRYSQCQMIDLIGQLRADPRTRALPLIITSTDSRLLEQFNHYLDDTSYLLLEKPFEIDDLIGRVKQSLEHRYRAAASEQFAQA